MRVDTPRHVGSDAGWACAAAGRTGAHDLSGFSWDTAEAAWVPETRTRGQGASP